MKKTTDGSVKLTMVFPMESAVVRRSHNVINSFTQCFVSSFKIFVFELAANPNKSLNDVTTANNKNETHRALQEVSY